MSLVDYHDDIREEMKHTPCYIFRLRVEGRQIVNPMHSEPVREKPFAEEASFGHIFDKLLMIDREEVVTFNGDIVILVVVVGWIASGGESEVTNESFSVSVDTYLPGISMGMDGFATGLSVNHAIGP